MKKKLAVGIASIGAIVLALSLTAFVIGAATVNPASPFDNATESSLPRVAPAHAAGASPLPSSAVPAGSGTKFASSGDNEDPTESETFTAMTPEEQANAREWLKTQQITATCMKDKGYDYTFVPSWQIDRSALPVWWINTLPESERTGALLALEGDTGAGADYHWDDAGCYGYAVHTMGNDSQH